MNNWWLSSFSRVLQSFGLGQLLSISGQRHSHHCAWLQVMTALLPQMFRRFQVGFWSQGRRAATMSAGWEPKGPQRFCCDKRTIYCWKTYIMRIKKCYIKDHQSAQTAKLSCILTHIDMLLARCPTSIIEAHASSRGPSSNISTDLGFLGRWICDTSASIQPCRHK